MGWDWISEHLERRSAVLINDLVMMIFSGGSAVLTFGGSFLLHKSGNLTIKVHGEGENHLSVNKISLKVSGWDSWSLFLRSKKGKSRGNSLKMKPSFTRRP